MTSGHERQRPRRAGHATSPDTERPGMATAASPEPPRFLSRDAYVAVLRDITHLAPGKTPADVSSAWRSDVRWSRNRILTAGEWRTVDASLRRGKVPVFVNQLDRRSLQNAVRWSEQMRQHFEGGLPDPEVLEPRLDPRTFPATAIWSDATYNQTQDTRLDIAEHVIAAADAAGMLSAGYLCVEAFSDTQILADGRVEYVPMTRAQCVISVRAPDGAASGWAGVSSYDWGRIDAAALAARALEKCLNSQNPVRIEPGRYTLIMEPQATFEFTKCLFGHLAQPDYLSLKWTLETPVAVFHGAKDRQIQVSQYGLPEALPSTRIGERVFDERINLHFDPQDPDLGVSPFNCDWGRQEAYPAQRVQWVTNGVLTALGYDPGARSLDGYHEPLDIAGVPYRGSYRLDGSGRLHTIEEMIATTERGLLVTRFWNPDFRDRLHMAITGTTRDGLWLIEQGTIRHPVRNLRWVDSPMYVLNKVEQIGTAVPVFSPGRPCVVPPLKVREFHFTSLEGAL